MDKVEDKEKSKEQLIKELVEMRQRISKLKKLETKRQLTEEEYRTITRTSIDGFWIVDMQGCFLDVNDAYCRLIGYSRRELLKMRIPDVEAIEKPEETAQRILKIVKTGGDRFETRHRRKDGRIVDIEVSVNYMKEAGGRMFVFLRDITERKHKEEEISRLIKAIEIAKEAIFITSTNGKITYTNSAMDELFGYKKGELLGKKSSILNAGSKPWVMMKKVVNEIEKQGFWEGEIQSKRKDGTEFISYIKISTLKDENGKIINFISTQANITEQKKIEQMKTDFVSVVSHQLLTPTAIIGGYIDILLAGLRGDLTDKQKECLYDMKEACTRSSRLVSDLLDVSRIERGVIEVDIKPVKLGEIIDLVVQDYLEPIKKKGLSLNLQGVEDETIILADKDKMVEALANAVNNAVKFTSQGSITIKAKSKDNFAFVEVKDTGKGISQDLLGKLFDKDQIFSSTPGAEKGAGLGLYITKNFMLLQNGDISVKSEVGKGSNFVFKIPLANT